MFRSAAMNGSLDRLRGKWISGPLLLLGVAAGYLGLAEFVIWLDDAMNLGTGFWPAAGLSLGLLLLVSPSRWGWVIAGIAVAELGGDLAHGHPLDAALWFTAGNCIEPLIGALLLRRWANPSGSLVPLRQFRRFFVAGVVVGPLVGGSIGWIGTVVALGHMGAWEAWPRYVLADAVGVLVVAPMLLCWKEQRIVRHLGETATLAAVLLAVTFVEFGTWGDVWDTALPYLHHPTAHVGGVASRVPRRGPCRLHGDQIAIWSTAAGHGPFAVAGAATGTAITLLQMFLVITAVSTFVLAALVEDLVDRTEVEVRLERLASTDELTGLPNRASLTSFLSGRLTSPSSPTGVGVCVCDLDHFKVVNDGLGHHAGDEVLVEVARRMSGCVRPSDLVARLGGDEFVIVKDSAGDELEDLARRLLVAVAKPMTLTDGTKLTPSISVGIAHCGPGADHSSLLRDADAALFRAKELGRGRFHRFDEQLRLQVVDRLFIQTELRGCPGQRRPLLRLPAGDRDRVGRAVQLRGAVALGPPDAGLDLTRPLHPRDRGHRGSRRSLRPCARGNARCPGAMGQAARLPSRRGDQPVGPPARRHRPARSRGQGAHASRCARLTACGSR